MQESNREVWVIGGVLLTCVLFLFVAAWVGDAVRSRERATESTQAPVTQTVQPLTRVTSPVSESKPTNQRIEQEASVVPSCTRSETNYGNSLWRAMSSEREIASFAELEAAAAALTSEELALFTNSQALEQHRRVASDLTCSESPDAQAHSRRIQAHVRRVDAARAALR